MNVICCTLTDLFTVVAVPCVMSINTIVYSHCALDVFLDEPVSPTDCCVDFFSNTSVCICATCVDDWFCFHCLNCRCYLFIDIFVYNHAHVIHARIYTCMMHLPISAYRLLCG